MMLLITHLWQNVLCQTQECICNVLHGSNICLYQSLKICIMQNTLPTVRQVMAQFSNDNYKLNIDIRTVNLCHLCRIPFTYQNMMQQITFMCELNLIKDQIGQYARLKLMCITIYQILFCSNKLKHIVIDREK